MIISHSTLLTEISLFTGKLPQTSIEVKGICFVLDGVSTYFFETLCDVGKPEKQSKAVMTTSPTLEDVHHNTIIDIEDTNVVIESIESPEFFGIDIVDSAYSGKVLLHFGDRLKANSKFPVESTSKCVLHWFPENLMRNLEIQLV